MAAHFNRVDIKVKKDKVKKLLKVLSYSTFQIYSPSINFKVFAWEVTEERPSHETRVSGSKDLEIMPSPGVTNTTSPPGIIKTRGGVMAGMSQVLIFWLGYLHSNCHHFLNPAAILNIKQHLGKQASHSSSCAFWQRREEESRDNSAGQNSSKPRPSSSHEPEDAGKGPQQRCLCPKAPRKFQCKQSAIVSRKHTQARTIPKSFVCADPETSPNIFSVC